MAVPETTESTSAEKRCGLWKKYTGNRRMVQSAILMSFSVLTLSQRLQRGFCGIFQPLCV